MTPSLARRLIEAVLPSGPIDAPADVDYTIVFPPTMLWRNYQRPHALLTHLARHHPVRALFNDWTVREARAEDGRLIVTKRAFRSAYHRRPLVYYYSIPEKLAYVDRYRLKPDLTVFELMDVPEEEFADWKRKLPEALARADLVRTTGPAITDYLRANHAEALGGTRVSTSRNGVDLELFDPTGPYERPPELAAVDKPILGFYGNLDWWIDWALVDALARLDAYQVVVIGDTEGREPKVPAELRASSVLWIDRKPVAELPAYLACFDVALFPFVVNAMTDAVDPLKVWEYLAFGKPVLASATAFVRARSELFCVVDPRDLAGSVAAALRAGDDPERVARGRAAATERDWRTIAAEFHAEIIAALGGRSG